MRPRHRRRGLLAGTRLAEWVGRGRHDGSAPAVAEMPSEELVPAEAAPRPRTALAHDGRSSALQYLVDHDQLTGLLNRHGFERVLDGFLPTAEARPGALIKLGIDNFRHLNASRGRQTCDLVLTAVARIVGGSPDARATARIEGDTFGILLADADLPVAETVAENALQAIRTADLGVGTEGIRATASAGIAMLDRPGLNAGDVLLEADLAMALAKQGGRDRAALAGPAEQQPFRATLEWAEAIRGALEAGSLALHCQPVRRTRGGGDRWELLLRLPQVNGQLLPPAAFLPTAERFGLAERVDAWVLDRAIDLMVGHHARGRKLELEINLSAQSLASETFVQRVAERLGSTHVDPGAVTFEVNEAALDERLDEITIVAARLKDLGCRFALDNFGTKHGSLAHLKLLPVDVVKIDGSFVRHMVDDAVDRTIVRAVVDLAHELERQVVAMFVGDAETLALLEAFGADYVQGFHIGKPRPAEELG